MRNKIVILSSEDFEHVKMLSEQQNKITYENAVSFSIGENFDVTEYHILIDNCSYNIADICGGYIYNDVYIYTNNKDSVLLFVNDFISDVDLNDVEVVVK